MNHWAKQENSCKLTRGHGDRITKAVEAETRGLKSIDRTAENGSMSIIAGKAGSDVDFPGRADDGNDRRGPC